MKKVEKIELSIVIIFIIILVSTFIYTKMIEKKTEDQQINTSVTALADVNRFFTIDSAISKYFSYVTSKNSESILKILSADYVSRNNITNDNIYNFVGNYDTNISSSLEEAYQFSSYNNIYKYYVKVVLRLETLYDSTFQEYVYYIVTINENELTFAIEPISETMYLNKIGEVDS